MPGRLPHHHCNAPYSPPDAEDSFQPSRNLLEIRVGELGKKRAFGRHESF
jgi:hypothetical protein